MKRFPRHLVTAQRRKGAVFECYNPATRMKAFVTVALKKTVLDPQGKAVQAALAKLGHAAIRDVRQGKCFELDLAAGTNPAAARTEVERVAREVLTNPVIEEFSIRWDD